MPNFSPRSRRSAATIPLRWVLVIPFVAQMVAVVVLVGDLSYWSEENTTEQWANQLLQQPPKRVRWQQIQLNLMPPSSMFLDDQGNPLGDRRISSIAAQQTVWLRTGNTLSTGEIQSNRTMTVLLGLLTLTAAIASGTVISSFMTARIRRLNQSHWDTVDGSVPQRLPADRTITEVKGLLPSFNQMAYKISDRKADEIALQKSEERFREIASTIPQMFFVRSLNPDRYEYISPAYETIWGHSSEGLLKNPLAWREYVHPEDLSRVEASVAAQLQGNDVQREYRIIRPDGEIRWISSVVTVVRDAAGHPIRFIGLAGDITDRKAAEVALRQSELKFSTIFRDTPQPAWIATLAEGRCLDVNDNFSRVLGYSRQEAIGKTCIELGLWHRLLDLLHFRESLQQSGQILDFEVVFCTKSGVRKTVLLSARVSHLEGQDCVLGVLSDITDRKLAEATLQTNETRLRLAMEISNAIAWERDLQTEEIFFTSTTSLAHSRRIPYKEMIAVIHPDDQPILHQANQRAIAECGTFQIEHRILTEGEPVEWRWFQVSARVITNDAGIPTRMIGLSVDITDHKRAEAELEQAKIAAEAANRAKSAFLANMSHELRTPLNSILGFTQLILMQHDSVLHSSHLKYLQIIEKSGKHLLGLINDVLDLSRIEAEKLPLEEQEISLSDLLHLIHNTFCQRAEAQGLHFRSDCSPEVPECIVVDAQKLQQVLFNLVGNAIKFTQQGSVTLHLSIETPNRTWQEAQNLNRVPLHFAVKDTGMGIALQELSSIFDAFAQAAAGRRISEGTGLGLAISQKLVQLMGGEITVSSIVDQGSTFEFTIPVEVIKSTHIPFALIENTIQGLAPDQPRYRILVVDDHPSNRLLLVKLLERLGLEVQEAIDGNQAIALWRMWQPHLIWMDMRMPNLDGYEATRRIRSEAAVGNGLRRTVIIGLTAQATSSDRAMVFEAGCDDYISKPFEAKLLFEKLEKHLGLTYRYTSDTTPAPQENSSTATTATAVDLSVLPTAWIADLHEAAQHCHQKSVAQLIQQIPEAHSSLAALLSGLNQNYAFGRIVTITQPHLKN